jgi:AI-2E family transporter
MIDDDPRIPQRLVPEAPGPEEEANASESEMPLPSPQTFFLGGLFVLSVLAALYVASSIILPIMLAFLLKLLLQPAVRLLERVHLPSVVGALLAILLVIGSLVGLVAALSVPAATWAERLPEGIPRLEAHLAVLKAPIEALQKVIQQAEQVADTGTKGSVVQVHRDLGLTGALFAGTRAVLDGLFTTVLVLYFLLVSGDIFLRRVVEILPTFKDRRQAVDISQQIEDDHIRLSGDDYDYECCCRRRDRCRDVSLRAWRPFIVGGDSLPAQLHSDFGTAVWILHLPPRRPVELR